MAGGEAIRLAETCPRVMGVDKCNSEDKPGMAGGTTQHLGYNVRFIPIPTTFEQVPKRTSDLGQPYIMKPQSCLRRTKLP